MKKKITIIIIFIIGAILASFFFIPKDFLFKKQLQIERTYKRIYYSVEDKFLSIFRKDTAVLPLAIKFHRQEHALTCEVSALRMALNYVGVDVDENELLKNLAFSTKEPLRNGIWGDPDQGFVGDIDGSIFSGTGYGVYEKPIYELALLYNNAKIMEDPTIEKVLDEVSSGNPVLVWGLLSHRPIKTWKTVDGKTIQAHPGEHVRIVIGYTGTIQNPKTIILMDPIYGKIYMSKKRFISEWNILKNRTIV